MDVGVEHAIQAVKAFKASLGYDKADSDYLERHYPWHNPGRACNNLPAHDHRADRIIYYPRIHINRPS